MLGGRLAVLVDGLLGWWCRSKGTQRILPMGRPVWAGAGRGHTDLLLLLLLVVVTAEQTGLAGPM